MPTYAYKCLDCEHQFDYVQKMLDNPLTKCPKCRGLLKRLIGTGAGILFKGSGFYSTDYRSDHYKKRAAEEKKSASPKEKSDKKSDKKKAKKPLADK